MAVYSFLGSSAESPKVRGTISADTPRSARDQLREKGIRVQTLRPLTADARAGWIGEIRDRRCRRLWAVAVHELSMLLRAGIPVTDAIETLAEQYRGPFQQSLKRLSEQVSAGSGLAEAMQAQPGVFDRASVRLVEVGENAGNLDVVLEELAELKQRMQQFGDKVFTALLYPGFLVVFGTAAGIFLMTWVLPPLLENLEETLTELPWPTRVAKAISETLLAHGWWLAVTVAVGIVVVTAAFRTPAGRESFDRWLLKLPGLGPMVRKQAVARVATVVGLLSRSGVTLNSAMELAAESTENRVMRRALRDCCVDMTAGREIADSLQRSGAFPPLAVRVFAVGQDSGEIDDMLIRLGQDYNQQLQTATQRVTALVEPLLILILAVFVGFLLLATILPILEAGQIQ